MIVHVIGQTMYTKDLYTFLNKNFNQKEHVFVTGKAKDPEVLAPIGLNRKADDIEIVSPINLIKYISLLNKCDGIVLHGVFSAKHLLLIARRKEWLRKTCWVLWGGDIYVHNKEKKTRKEKLAEWARLRYARNIEYIASIAEKDYALAQEWYHVVGKKFLINYPTPLQRKGVLSMLGKCAVNKGDRAPGQVVNIVLGNSATSTNCHKEALEKLKKYKQENFKLYLPLSYGFSGYEKYAEEILRYAIGIFGEEKVTPITEKIDGVEYSQLLGIMDVAIFNNDRQQAMGNIAILLAAGTKIYIRDDTTMWSHYVERGYLLEDASEIGNSSFEAFLQYDRAKKENNVKLINRYVDINLLKEKWGKIFDEMKENVGVEH